MIDQLIAALSKEVEMSAEEIADTIWLALQMQEFQTESVSSSSSPEEKEINKQESQLDSETSPKTTPNTSDFEKTSAQLSTEQKAGVYPKSQQKTSESLDISFKVPDAPSLREPLTLARALKPLMRRIPSGRELILDEAATIQQIADEKLWTPILKPTLEPWLDLELVVDEAISMQIWRHTIRELERLLKNYGIFRDVRIWGLITNENEQVQIRRGVGATAKNETPRSAKELIDPSGRRLILVVSDCVSSFWRNGKVTPVLELWAKQGTMAIVQMLPKWLWKRTALGRASEVRLRGLTPGVVNQKLIAKEVSLWDELDEESGVKVPVFTLEEDKVVTWAQMLSGKGSIWTLGYVFKLNATSVKKETGLFNLAHSDLSAEQRVQAFRVTASPMARKLAGLLASAPVISLPIVRLIREALLKDSQQVHVAEVFLGGLLKPLSEINADTNPDYVQYEFMDGVRELLIDSVPSKYVLNVVDEVSKYVAKKAGLSLENFAAVLRNPQQIRDSEFADKVAAFATVTVKVLRRLGGEYALLAEQLERPEDSLTEQGKSAPESPGLGGILHFYLKLSNTNNNYVELRYFEDNPNRYQSRYLALAEIADLIELSERDYYISLPADYVETGTKLFKWLDGNDRFFQQLLDKQRRKGIVLAISAGENLAHLPWELLHDGKSFLVERKPGIIPVRWVSSDINQRLTIKPEPENRALQMLFMAASPLNMEPVLDFEREEASILTATARQPLTLTVEKSGCLQELGYLVEDYGKGYFDVLHLTGHATIKDGTPAFITESPTGEAVESTADDIASELQFQLPKLIFLSGCRTGQAGNSGAVPSMAESLLDKGAASVLGWGQKVLDTDATAAAESLYQALSSGKLLSESLALTYQALIKNKARDWHLLRLYVGNSLPGKLVTPLRTRGRKPAAPRSFNAEFLDAAGKVKVPTRESFVGRRRQLQNCLRTLINPSSAEIGVLIHGMGGLGKSSLAARLCDRLTNFQRVVWVGGIDEASLVSRLTDKLDNQDLRETLQNPDEELKFRLKKVFAWLQETRNNPFLLILDDFEANLEPRNDSYILQSEAARVLSALVWAIDATDKFQRIIITCRYDFESTYLQQFYKQPLEGMHGADLRKKLNRLAAFEETSQVDETLQAKAQQLADGNPRLLEWLDKLLQSNVDVAAILDKLADDSVELREQVLASQLLQQMDDTMRKMLQLGLVFELPVPREALAAVCKNIVDLGNYIDKAIALGLLEVSPDESLRVPRILPLDKTTVIATKVANREIFKIAARVLYRLWWENKETYIEEKALEIHRLALLGRETEIAAEFASVLGNRWIKISRFREAVKLCKSTLDITEDYRVLNSLARSEAELGDVELAEQHYQQALELCRQEDETEKATIIHNLAIIYAQQGEVSQAINLYQQSLELFERIGDVQGKAASLRQLAIIYAQQGEVSQAINLYQQSLELFERIGDVQGKAASLRQLAIIYAQQGEVSQAINLYQQSLELFERIGDVQGKAASLRQLAIIYAQQGEVSQAINLYQQSLELFERIGDVQGKAASLRQLAIIYAQQGEVSQAINLYQQSLELFERIGDVQGKAMTLYGLGNITQQQGDNTTALAYLQESFEILQRIKSPDAQTVKQIIDRILE